MKTIYAHEITNQVVTDRTRAEAVEQLAKQLADGEISVLETIPHSNGKFIYNIEEMMYDVIAKNHIVKSMANFTLGKTTEDAHKEEVKEALLDEGYRIAEELLSGFTFSDD